MSTIMNRLTISRDAAGVARVTMNRRQVSNAFDEVTVAELDDAQYRGERYRAAASLRRQAWRSSLKATAPGGAA